MKTTCVYISIYTENFIPQIAYRVYRAIYIQFILPFYFFCYSMGLKYRETLYFN
jgi:hypothetical protein